MTEPRLQAIDFTIPVFTNRAKLFITKPKESLNYHTFVEVLSTTFWIVISCVVLLMSMVTYLFSKYANFQKEPFGVANSLAVPMLALILHPYPLSTHLLSSKILILTILITNFVIYVAYCATLTSVLTLEHFDPPVKNLADVLTKGYKLTVWKGTSYDSYFREASPGTLNHEVSTMIINSQKI